MRPSFFCDVLSSSHVPRNKTIMIGGGAYGLSSPSPHAFGNNNNNNKRRKGYHGNNRQQGASRYIISTRIQISHEMDTFVNLQRSCDLFFCSKHDQLQTP